MDTETSKDRLKRIKLLKIPPNWTDVVISKDPTDYLQAYGHDASGKTQYLYHPLFIQLTTYEKFMNLKNMSKNYKKICKKIEHDLKRVDLKDPRFLIAVCLSIVKHTYIRVGNKCYARDNKTYGLTTLLTRHFKIVDDIITLKFPGKRRIVHTIPFKDSFLSKIIKRLILNKGPNDTVFESITAIDLNNYLQEFNITCKDFRTYYANILFINKIKQYMTTKTSSGTAIINKSYNEVANSLGHSKAISKKAYVFPKIAEIFLENPSLFKREPGFILNKLLSV
jgi:DNA topoisomerase-1